MIAGWRAGLAATAAALVMACTGSEEGGNGNPVDPTPQPSNISAPTLEGPIDGVQLSTLRPTLTVRNSTSTGSGSRLYEFQVSDRSDFSSAVASYIPGMAVVVTQGGIPEGPNGTTSYTLVNDLQPSTTMYWRARFLLGPTISPWSSTGQFRTRLTGFNRPGELYDPLLDDTLGQRVGNTTFMGSQGLRVDDHFSWVRYQLASTLQSGEISVEVQGLAPNGTGAKARIVSMMDNAPNLFYSKYLFNVQYRGVPGNPDNAISYKVLMGDGDLKYEPELHERLASVKHLNPGTTYLWTATWGSVFRLVIREGGVNGPVIYDKSHNTPGTYAPTPHVVMLGSNDAAEESGSFAGAIYRNLWVGAGPRPSSLGSALAR